MNQSSNTPSERKRRGLGAWLGLAFSLLSIVLTLLLVAVVDHAATQQVKNRIGHGLSELATQAADKLDRGMFERYREVRLLSSRADLVGAGGDLAARRAVLDGIQDTYGYYDWIGLADREGKVTVAGRGLLEGKDVSKRPWFHNALRGIHVGDVHEAVLLAKLLPQQGGEPRRFVDVAFPFLDRDGVPAGVLGVHLSWQWAREVERSVIAPLAARSRVEALILDRAGQVLLGPAALQGKTLDLASFRAAQEGQGFLVEDWPDGSWLVGFSRSKGYDSYPGLGWTVLVRQPVDAAYAPVRQLSTRLLWSGAALALLFSLVGLVVARYITRPLGQLALEAERIGRGEQVALSAGTRSYREMDALSGTLNTLVADLVRGRQDLLALNASLGQRVEARTGELEAALAAVQASERRINAIVDAAQDAFVGVDLRGLITDWNGAAERMFGWKRTEVLGWPMAELMLPARFRASAVRAIEHYRATGHSDLLRGRIERLVIDRRGTEFPIEMTASLSGSGEAFFAVFLHDISERKDVERMKNEFVATVSHELRTPLTSIRASLAMLADGTAGELPRDVAGLVGIAHQSCERLVRLVGDVLDIQKIDAGAMQYELDAAPVLRAARAALDTMEGAARAAGVELRLDLAPGGEALLARIDHDRIVQVLVNLLSNAIKFSPRGAEVVLALDVQGDAVRVSVRDSGPGIPEAFRSRIFGRFAQADGADTRRNGGTGLGLSISKRIVEDQGGRIGFGSTPGQGAVFYVDLPRVAAAVDMQRDESSAG